MTLGPIDDDDPRFDDRLPVDYFGEDCDLGDIDMNDCGELGDGTCMYAGTEWCDWDCPFS